MPDYEKVEGAYPSDNNNVDSVNSTKSPLSNLDEKDPGDDVLQRFRYQITYAGILALILVKATNDFEELYCEHHEDILLKHRDGKFTGIQVKTKEINLHPFSLEDESMKATFKRFVLLNKAYPDKFKVFSIVSNHGFDKTKPAVCINTLIKNVAEGNDVLKSNTKTKSFIKWLASQCNCTIDCVLDTLKKTRTLTFCALNDIDMKLVNELKTCEILKGSTESKLKVLSDLIISKFFKASSLHLNGDDISSKYLLGMVEKEDVSKAIIDSKRITKKDFEAWLAAEKMQPVTLLLKDRIPIQNGSEGHRKLEVKMDAGGIDSENIDLVRDFKFAFEQHTLSWIYKDNNDEAEEKYNQILRVTQNLCKEVYDEIGVKDKLDAGLPMLIKVRNGIKERRVADPQVFFDCSHEHIIGAVGVLTEKCKVWWSSKFEIPE